MLKLKKIDSQKLLAYLLTIALMFGGTIYFIYKNYTLTVLPVSSRTRDVALKIEKPSVYLINEKDRSDLDMISTSTNSGTNTLIDKDLEKIMDTDLFMQEKWINLKDHKLDKRVAPTGKPDIFEDY